MTDGNNNENELGNKVDEAIQQSVKLFFGADRSLSGTQLNRGGLIRAIRFAMHNGLTEKEVKLKSEAEMKLAVIFGTMLEARLIMQAKLLKNDDENQKQENNDESKES